MQVPGCDVRRLAALVSLQPFITVALQVLLWGLQKKDKRTVSTAIVRDNGYKVLPRVRLCRQ